MMQFEGVDRILRELERMGRVLDSSVKEEALKKGAEVLKSNIKNQAPVRTGKLKGNIVISDVKDDSIQVGADQQGDAFYGHFLEFGTSKMSAQPFVGPAFESSKTAVEDTMSDVIKRRMGL